MIIDRSLPTVSEEISQPTPESSPEMTKRSWFSSLMSTEKEETYTIIVKGKGLSTIKADLVQAFLSVSGLANIFWTLNYNEIEH